MAACGLFGVALVASGCLNKPAFECAGAGDCLSGGTQGICEPDHYCSFSDPACPSGQRYGDLSGPQANDCVPIPPDAAPDAYVPDMYIPDARECFGGTGAYQLCFAGMPPMGNVTLVGTLDTTGDARCMTMPTSWMTAGQPDACMILGKAITIGTITVTGTRPLVVLGDTITINGTLDVSTHKGAPMAGPGAPATQCPATFPQDPVTNMLGAGGGAGGSFKGKGGNGGAGKNSSIGGLANPAVANPTILRAGCPGQLGGMGVDPAGAPGQGGGAVFLTATKMTFTATGVINASGAGGIATSNFSGGSGGGSGGMIVIHAADTITATAGAKLIANGGGGASGASQAGAGADGSDPTTGAPTTPAPGGDQTGNGDGPGGAGGAAAIAAVNGTDAQATGGQRDTGGGGGGGVGYIQSNKTITNLTASPAITVVP